MGSKITDRMRRAAEALRWRLSKPAVSHHQASERGDADVTFLIAHFNSPEFLTVCLHAIRKFHPGSRVVVADATSDWDMYLEAKETCNKFGAEMHTLVIQHRHSGILNYLFRQPTTEIAVFLDQDCIVLNRLDALFEQLRRGIVLAGPRDDMRVDHPNWFQGFRVPQGGAVLRRFPDYIHASLMVVNPRVVRQQFGNSPFTWKKEFGDHPHEKYHGLSHLLKESKPESLLPLPSSHSAYGLGTVCSYNDKALAYHNWYSGRVHNREGRIDNLEVERLRKESRRFLDDYWKERLAFDLPKIGLPSPAPQSTATA